MWVWQRKGFCKEDFLCTFYSSKRTLSEKESEQNDQYEPGDNLSQKTLKEQKKREGEKKEERWSQKNLPLMQGQQ